MTLPLSYPEREDAVIGYIAMNGFCEVASPGRTHCKAFTKPLASLIYEAALHLHRNRREVNFMTIEEAIENDSALSKEAKAAASKDGLADWKDYLYSADSSLAHNKTHGGEFVTECLNDITEAYGRRKAAEIGRKLQNAEIPISEASEALSEIQSHGKAQQVEPLLDARRITLAKKPPEPPLVFGLAGHKISTAGNLTVIAAQAKAGKTAAVGAMLARLFAEPDSDGDFLGFEAAPPNGKAVVLFDTEQSPFDAWRVMSRTMSRAGREDQPPNLRAYFLLDLCIQERRAALLAELKRAERICGGIHSIIIDGGADLCEDVNDPKEANGLVNELVSLAVRYFCPVVCILHENPGNPKEAWKTRGHLGSQLERKAESNLRVKKDSEGVSVIYSERGCRHAEIPEPKAPRFKFCDKAGMHISCECPMDLKAGATREKMLEEVRQIFNTPESIAGLSWEDTHNRIQAINGIERSGARKRFDKLVAAGLLKKNTVGKYTR